MALLSCGPSQEPAAPSPGPSGTPSLLLVTIDTLRADHLGIDGYARDTSPNLDALAREGAWFGRTYSASGTTGAAHASLFYSVLPPVHGVLSNDQVFPDRVSLMSVLRGSGYRIGAFVSSAVLSRSTGLQRYFDHFDDLRQRPERNRPEFAERPARDTVDASIAWIDAQPPEQPFFAWLHVIDPHGPYEAPEDPDRYLDDTVARENPRAFPLGKTNYEPGAIPKYQALGDRRDAGYYIARYDAEIHYADAELGRLFAYLERRGRAPDTFVAVTADHGETLAESNRRLVFSHGVVVHEEVARVPLILRAPRGNDALSHVRRDLPVSSLDVAPTLLALLGQPIPGEFAGRNLLTATLREEAPMPSFGAYGTPIWERALGTQFSLRRGPWRLVHETRGGRDALYDHRADPGETRDVTAAHEKIAQALRDEIFELKAVGTRSPSRPVSTPAEREALRALGYAE